MSENASPVLIAHDDADGLISVILFLKKYPTTKFFVYFTSHRGFKRTLDFVRYKDGKELFIIDVSPTEEILPLCSEFEKIVWIDHHQWNNFNLAENVEIIHKASQSSASLTASYLQTESELVEIANQIDTNSVKSEDAEFLRNVVNALKWRYMRTNLLNMKLKKLAVIVALNGIEKIKADEKIASIVEKNKERLKLFENSIFDRSFINIVNSLKVAVCETTESIPVHIIVNKLSTHKDGPFDVIAVLYHKLNRARNEIATTVELRTHTEKEVINIAKRLGGGGHRVACGASVNHFMSTKEFLEVVKSIKM